MKELMAWITGLIAMVVPGFGEPAIPKWNGYVEADYVYAGAPTPGTIERVAVREGDAVAAGAILFILTATQQEAALAAAEARVAAAQANLENLTTGSRKEETDVIRASLARATADFALAKAAFERSEKLLAQGLIPAAKFEQDKAQFASAQAQVDQLDAQLKVAELPARDAQQLVAEANLAAARADAERARSELADRRVMSPVEGRVERIYYAPGEQAAAGAPVVALLPAGALKVRFYLPEGDRAGFAIGSPVAVQCDGCTGSLTARLSYLSSDPQFTPPVIYSRDERSRLTFLAEAVLDPGASLPPGQPVTVTRPQ